MTVIRLLFLISVLPAYAAAFSGIEGASFLDIPVSAEAVSLGGAYTALATNAYATVWNPAGLAVMQGTQVSAMHLSYLESSRYEYASFAHRFPRSGVGLSAQYLNPGTLTGRDLTGAETGEVHGYYGALEAAYGVSLGETFSLGVGAKRIQARISDRGASSWAMDAGLLWQASQTVALAASVLNIGKPLTFLSAGDPLPRGVHLGTAIRLIPTLTFSAEPVWHSAGLFDAHAGLNWDCSPQLSLRAGYDSESVRGLKPIAGARVGVGVHVGIADFSYAFVPLAELGQAHYFSLLLHFGTPAKSSRKADWNTYSIDSGTNWDDQFMLEKGADR